MTKNISDQLTILIMLFSLLAAPVAPAFAQTSGTGTPTPSLTATAPQTLTSNAAVTEMPGASTNTPPLHQLFQQHKHLSRQRPSSTTL